MSSFSTFASKEEQVLTSEILYPSLALPPKQFSSNRTMLPIRVTALRMNTNTPQCTRIRIWQNDRLRLQHAQIYQSTIRSVRRWKRNEFDFPRMLKMQMTFHNCTCRHFCVPFFAGFFVVFTAEDCLVVVTGFCEDFVVVFVALVVFFCYFLDFWTNIKVFLW